MKVSPIYINRKDLYTRKTGWDKIRISPIYINKEDYKRDRMR